MTEGFSDKFPPATRLMHKELARRLRHETADFLQKVYSTVGIMQMRLPAEMHEEREHLRRLRTRAEDLCALVDAIQDYLVPLQLECTTVDVAALAAELVTVAQSRYPTLQIEAVADGPALVQADPTRATQIGKILLTNACQSAAAQVTFRTEAAAAAGPVWSVTDDGAGVSGEAVERMFEPFFTTRGGGHAGLGLPLAEKLVLLHGGRISAGNHSPNGFAVRVHFPGASDPRNAG